MLYGVYENKARIHWPPSKIFEDEIQVSLYAPKAHIARDRSSHCTKIIGSFAQTYCFPRAVEYLDSGKINVEGMVTDVYALENYQEALDKMHSRSALKIAIKP